MSSDFQAKRRSVAVAITLALLAVCGWLLRDTHIASPTTPRVVANDPNIRRTPADNSAPSTASEDELCEEARGIQAHVHALATRALASFEGAWDMIDRDIDRWPEQIEGSDDPELIYVSSYGPLRKATGSLEAEDRSRRIARALRLDESNPIYLSSLLGLCIEHPTLEACDLPALEARLAQLDNDNGMSWSLIATSCAARDEPSCAIAAMERAAVAPSYRDYVVERALMAERAMMAGGINFSLRSTASMRMATEMLPSTTLGDHDPCAVEDVLALHVACRRYGEQLERRAQSSWTESLGRAIQARVAKRLGDQAALDIIERRHATAEGTRSLAISDGELSSTYEAFTRRLLWDRSFYMDYMAHWREVGETQAYLDVATGWGTGPPECFDRQRAAREADAS